MGVVATIDADKFPRQGSHLGCEVKVCFNYDSSRIIRGRIIRDDMEEPFRTVIMLEDERVVLSIECQYSLPALERKATDETT